MATIGCSWSRVQRGGGSEERPRAGAVGWPIAATWRVAARRRTNPHKPAGACYNQQRMLTAERRQANLARLTSDGKVVASELVNSLGVSEDTVRRDLKELDSQGLVRRVHGGALPPTPTINPRFVERRKVDHAQKAAIGAAAAGLVRPGDVVLLSGGTTVLEFARRLPDDLDATVLTTGPDVAVV